MPTRSGASLSRARSIGSSPSSRKVSSTSSGVCAASVATQSGLMYVESSFEGATRWTCTAPMPEPGRRANRYVQRKGANLAAELDT